MNFVLPYIIYGQKPVRSFIEVSAASITAAATSSEEFLREKYAKLFGRKVCIAVAEVDFTHLDRETGKPLARPAYQAPQNPGFRYARRRRRYARA